MDKLRDHVVLPDKRMSIIFSRGGGCLAMALEIILLGPTETGLGNSINSRSSSESCAGFANNVTHTQMPLAEKGLPAKALASNRSFPSLALGSGNKQEDNRDPSAHLPGQ